LPLGTAAAPAYRFQGDTNTGIYSPGADQVAISTNGTGRLFVDASGNVDIASSSQALTLLNLNASTTGNASIRFNDTTANIGNINYNFTDDALTFRVNASERLRITSAGLVGVGTSSPQKSLEVNGAVRLSSDANALLELGRFSAGYGGAAISCLDSSFLRFQFAGTDRMTLTSGGSLGIGTTSPQTSLDVNGSVRVRNGNGYHWIGESAATDAKLWDVYTDNTTANTLRFRCVNDAFSSSNTWLQVNRTATEPTAIIFSTGTSEKVRIDSSGRLLVGTSSARTNLIDGTRSASIQCEGTTGDNSSISAIRNALSIGQPSILLGKTRGTTVGSNTIVAAEDGLGNVQFMGADGTSLLAAASIGALVDGTPGLNDMPGRLVFSTTADGASSPTERMRISQKGAFKVSTDGTYVNVNDAFHEFVNSNSNNQTLITWSKNASFASRVIEASVNRAANTAYSFFTGISGAYSAEDSEFILRGDGNAFADGSWSGGGADYAEYFEWSDSNPNAEDRRGISVVLDGDKIREAQAGEDPIGVISGNPSVVGDAAWNKWSGKYLRDEFGTYIQEDYEVTDDDGNTVIQQRRKLNPAYDPDVEYISREQRPEWDCVGLMGKLRIRKGQVTGSRWIKMRDISATVEEWLVR
jgi:hypothetical protein